MDLLTLLHTGSFPGIYIFATYTPRKFCGTCCKSFSPSIYFALDEAFCSKECRTDHISKNWKRLC